jgi:hypothetical protein
MEPLALVVSLTALLFATVTFADVCELYYDESSSYCIDETAQCYRSYAPAITCEEAYMRVARRYGSVPFPAEPDGLVRAPLIIESDRPSQVTDAVANDPRVESILHDVTKHLGVVNVELAHWAPRVLYIPDRIGAVLRSLMADLRILENLGEFFFPAILGSFYSNHEMSEFLFRVTTLTDVAVLMPDLRTNGFLNALIPFLHVATEIIFMFPFRELGGVLVDEVAFLQTITQYHPMYTEDPLWRLRLFNPNHVKWREYPVERYILPVETRDDEWCPNSAPMDLSLCYESVSGTLKVFIEKLSVLARNLRSESVSAATGELLSDILYLMDRMYQSQGYEEVFALISSRMRLLCSAQLGEICFHIRFSQFAQFRSRALLAWFLPECVPESVRIQRVMVVNQITTTGENCPSVDVNDGEDLVRFFSIENPMLLIPCIHYLWSESPGIRAVVIELLAIRPGSSVRPMEDRRAIGRMMGYLLWDIRHAFGISPSVPEFYHSVEVRRGVYDILPYGCLETLRVIIYD